ncbi:hotdog domain-containing protein [Streptomyces sp. NPDC056835]|uniref:hotdog domain-containing protein n=1 Tax=Streptomyces sp. NPDC056835 TaxID=3345956 RepID=UPI0036CE8C1A
MSTGGNHGASERLPYRYGLILKNTKPQVTASESWGFAATATGGNVTASHCAVNFLAPAQGNLFVARARVVKAGRRQVFVDAQLMAEPADSSAVVATGNTVLVPLSAA